MATITKTFTENYSASNKSTWTINITGTNQTLSTNTALIAPVVTAKYVGSNKGRAGAIVSLTYVVGDYTLSSSNHTYQRPTNAGDESWTSGTQKTLTLTQTYSTTVSLGSVFTAANKTTRTVNVVAYNTTGNGIQLLSTDAYASYYNEYTNYTSFSYGTIATITLDKPPNVNIGTPTYATPHYAGLGTYTVPITSLVANYGGDISKVTLTIGQDSTEQTYSSQTVSSQTISVTPSVAGTFTPTLTVEDSRGQTTVTTFSNIVVNPYLNPSLDFDVFRANSSGVRDDEGAYGLVTANVSFTDAIADLTKPTVKINGTTTNNVTWYSAYSSSTGVSSAISDWTAISSGATIYGLINGSFNQTDSYSITVSLTDSLGGNSAEITQTLSTAFYTIDFQAGGKEIAFGAPANDDITDFNGNDYSTEGLFKCEMGTAFNDMSAAEVSAFVAGLNFSGTAVVDYVVEQGTSGIWTYRKWNSGVAECWGMTSVASNAYSANGGSKQVVQSLPTGLFNVKPNSVSATGKITATIQTGTGYTSADDTTNAQTYLINRGTSAVTQTGAVYWSIKGTWK